MLPGTVDSVLHSLLLSASRVPFNLQIVVHYEEAHADRVSDALHCGDLLRVEQDA